MRNIIPVQNRGSKYSMTGKAIIIVLDGVGAGAQEDASEYGDAGANTLGNLSEYFGGLNIPNLRMMGLANAVEMKGVEKEENPIAFYGKMKEKSAGKDSTSGHWEIAGTIRHDRPMLYPHGFPTEVIDKFHDLTGYGCLGNIPASGTEIMERLGKEHLKSGKLIIYTSADSVFQIAGHEDVISVEELYETCEIVRNKIMDGKPYNVDRVIARPFVGEPGGFKRIRKRKDFSIAPPYPNLLDLACENRVEVVGIGKIDDLFGGRGLSSCTHTISNSDGIEQIKKILFKNISNHNKMLIFANLIDFDQEYGHRNDKTGFRKALEEFDESLTEILKFMNNDDLLAITADHGCDPTIETSTDHSREMAPLIVKFDKISSKNRNLGIRESFSDLGASVASFLGLPDTKDGVSFF